MEQRSFKWVYLYRSVLSRYLKIIENGKNGWHFNNNLIPEDAFGNFVVTLAIKQTFRFETVPTT